MRHLPLLNGTIRAWRAKDGVAALEFAIVLPVLLFFVAEAFSLGTLFWAKMQVENAARAGAIYAATRSVNMTTLNTVVAGATRLGPDIIATPDPTESCGCPNEADASGVIAAACTDQCASGARAGQYVTVFTRTTYSVPFPLPVLGTQVTLTGKATTRTNR